MFVGSLLCCFVCVVTDSFISSIAWLAGMLLSASYMCLVALGVFRVCPVTYLYTVHGTVVYTAWQYSSIVCVGVSLCIYIIYTHVYPLIIEHSCGPFENRRALCMANNVFYLLCVWSP